MFKIPLKWKSHCIHVNSIQQNMSQNQLNESENDWNIFFWNNKKKTNKISLISYFLRLIFWCIWKLDVHQKYLLTQLLFIYIYIYTYMCVCVYIYTYICIFLYIYMDALQPKLIFLQIAEPIFSIIKFLGNWSIYFLKIHMKSRIGM